MIIPKGKKVVFKQGGSLLPGTENIDMLLDEDITLSLQSQFGDVVSGGAPQAIGILGSLSRDIAGFGFSGQFKQLGFQVWQKTEPLMINITVAFNMKTNAYTDVVAPTRALIKLPLPDDGSAEEDGLGLIPPGPSILEAFSGETRESSGRLISCRIGFVRLPGVIVTRAEPTFSKETDQNGWPIYSKVMLEIRTIYTATTNLVDQMGWEEL